MSMLPFFPIKNFWGTCMYPFFIIYIIATRLQFQCSTALYVIICVLLLVVCLLCVLLLCFHL